MKNHYHVSLGSLMDKKKLTHEVEPRHDGSETTLCIKAFQLVSFMKYFLPY